MTLPMPTGLPFPDARLLSRQGMRPHRSFWHNGIDLAQRIGDRSVRGTPGGPVAVGTVEAVCRSGSRKCSGYGNTVLVEHGDDLYSQYSHLDEIYVEEGDEVFPGDHMYDVGVTFGTPDDPERTLPVPHLHLEIVHAGWPFSARDTGARYDVLHELAAAGLGLVGSRLAYREGPFEYDEPGLADVGKARSFGAVPKELDWPKWPIYVSFGGVAVASALIALAPGRGREREIARRFPRG